MGARHSRHVFMPHMFVFPGGRVDDDDEDLALPGQLTSATTQALLRSVDARRARALGLTAIRETFEETGLAAGYRAASSLNEGTRLPVSWQGFAAAGFVPAIDALHYVARAITPPGNSRRFDARFFMIDARLLHGAVAGSGELESLDWFTLDAALKLPLGDITALVLEVLRHRLETGSSQGIDQRSERYRALFGSELIEHL